jgi:hypothetical protein
VFRRKEQFKNSVKRTNDLGWWSNRPNKEAMFTAFYQAVKTGELTLRSDYLVKETAQYVRINGRIEHVLNTTTEDESSKGEAHGDRVIAACVALQGAKDRPLASVAAQGFDSDNPPYGTLAWREKFHREQRESKQDEWDDRTCDDLAAGERVPRFDFREVG